MRLSALATLRRDREQEWSVVVTHDLQSNCQIRYHQSIKKKIKTWTWHKNGSKYAKATLHSLELTFGNHRSCSVSHDQSWATEAIKRCDEALNASSLHCFNLLPYIKFHHFLNLPPLPECFNKKNMNILYRSNEAMTSFGNFQKNLCYFRRKAKIIVVFALHILESFALFYGYFCMDLYNVDSDEVMKRGNEVLNASSLQFLSSVKFFIATIFSQH
jgi:hypothetical protein